MERWGCWGFEGWLDKMASVVSENQSNTTPGTVSTPHLLLEPLSCLFFYFPSLFPLQSKLSQKQQSQSAYVIVNQNQIVASTGPNPSKALRAGLHSFTIWYRCHMFFWYRQEHLAATCLHSQLQNKCWTFACLIYRCYMVHIHMQLVGWGLNNGQGTERVSVVQLSLTDLYLCLQCSHKVWGQSSCHCFCWVLQRIAFKIKQNYEVTCCWLQLCDE